MYTDNKLGFGVEVKQPQFNNVYNFFGRGLVAQPAPVSTPATITPAVPSVPVFANIDNSAFYANPTAQAGVVPPAANATPLPAGIKAVDYSVAPSAPTDYLKVALYGIGAIGLFMLLSHVKKGR